MAKNLPFVAVHCQCFLLEISHRYLQVYGLLCNPDKECVMGKSRQIYRSMHFGCFCFYTRTAEN